MMKHITGRTDLPTYDEDNVVYEIIEDLLMKVSDLHFADNHIVSESIPNVSTDISQSNLSFHDLATSSVSSSNVDSEKTIKEAKNMSEPLERQEACASKDTFLTRLIQFRGNIRRIVMQSKNGPCPLIAAVNALSLLECISVPSISVNGCKDIITRSELTDLIGGLIVAPRPQLSQDLLLNYEKKVADVLEILPSLGYGLDVNVKFNDITGFEYTKQIDLFDLLNLRIYHSWKVEGHYTEAVGDQFYTQVSEKATMNELLNDFLCDTQSQMTYSGLFALQETVPENSVSVLFRNNHFHTMLRHNNRLYLLATDIGFIGQHAVWEILDNIDGDSDWVNENFESIKGTNTKHYNFDYKQLDQEPSKASSTVIKNINMEHYNFDGKRLDKDHREVPSTAFDHELAHRLQREETQQRHQIRSQLAEEKDSWSNIVKRNREKCMTSVDPQTTLCRYFASGCCSQGDRCMYSHDRTNRTDNVCRFYAKGHCGYGTACRYDHVRPKKQTVEPAKKNQPLPKPVKLPAPGLNANAAEFVPTWKKIAPGTSYSKAVGAVVIVEHDEKIVPLCPYYEIGECVKPDCKFIHGTMCEFCNKNCLHPHDEEQRRTHAKSCVNNHELAMEEAFAEARSASKTCGICMENIKEKGLRFGILNNCRHCFCLECIRAWRKNHGFETKVIRSCPECRQHSHFVIPSTIWVEDDNEKDILLELYKENTGQKQCKYYKDRISGTACPFGNKCFYKHQLPDGSIDPGESPHARRRPLLSDFIFRMDSDDSDDDTNGFLEQVLQAFRLRFD